MAPALFASDVGTGDTATVLLHGFGGWHGAWDGIAAGLSGRVIAYDLPGHGGSMAFPDRSARLAAQAILADLGLRGITKMHLAGHSMGGAVATLMALAEPARAASLTLLAPGGFGEEINSAALRRYAEAISAEQIRDCLAAMCAPGGLVSEDAVRHLESMRKAPGQTQQLLGMASTITRDGKQGVIPRDSLAKLKMPVRVLWGDTDPILPFAQALDLPEGFELQVAAGAGHMLIEEAPGAVLAMIRQASASHHWPAGA